MAASVAAILGAASAAISAFWALSGTALLDTVGGEIERWGRQRSTGVVAALWILVVAKLVAAAAPLVMVGSGSEVLPSWTRSRSARALSWLVSIALTAYGGLLTGVGLLVELGVVDAAASADEHALAWHTYFWDPWFLIWGGASTLAMWRSRDEV